MSGTAFERTPGGFFMTQEQRLKGVERRIGHVRSGLAPGGSDVASSYRGTTIERDLVYGIPATDAERVALANRRIDWFNRDTGWAESYYATTGLSGLTARALIAGVPSGWYPIGAGPQQLLRPSATFTANSTQPVRGWLGTRERNGGTAWFDYNDTTGRVQIPRGGRYEIRVWTTQQTGSGTANYHLRNLSGGTVLQHVDGLAFPLDAAYYTQAFGNTTMAILPGTELEFYCHAGILSIHMGSGSTLRGEFSVEYTGPALVSD